MDASTNDRRPFLEMILAHLDDNGPRLVYADWLEEHGEPVRAEFIRLQCRYVGRDAGRTATGNLADREAELLATHADAWCVGLPDNFARRDVAAWSRGFPRHASYFAQTFVDDIEALLAHSVVESVTLQLNLDHDIPGTDDIAWVERLAACPSLRSVTEIGAGNSGFGPERFAVLFGSPHLTRLSRLSNFEDTLGLAGVRALVDPSTVFTLDHLYLNGCLSDEPGEVTEAVRLLANAPKLSRLKTLELYYNQFGEAELEVLIASPTLPSALSLILEEGDWEPLEELLDRIHARFPG